MVDEWAGGKHSVTLGEPETEAAGKEEEASTPTPPVALADAMSEEGRVVCEVDVLTAAPAVLADVGPPAPPGNVASNIVPAGDSVSSPGAASSKADKQRGAGRKAGSREGAAMAGGGVGTSSSIDA